MSGLIRWSPRLLWERFFTYSCIVGDEEGVYHFADYPEKLERIKEQRLTQVERRFADLMALPAEERANFLCVGG